MQTEYKRHSLSILQSKYTEGDIFQQPSLKLANLKSGKKIIFCNHITNQELSSNINALEKIDGKSSLGKFHYYPISLSYKEKLSKEDKITMSFKGYILGHLQSKQPEYGKMIYGQKKKSIKIKMNTSIRKVKNVIEKIKEFSDTPPPFFLNRHCQICQFQKQCKDKAIEEDHLSLLNQLGHKEIIKKNNKGVFTINQLSYTFRPRRKRKKPDGYRRPHSIALRALAIREQKIHVYEMPSLPNAKTEIYLDVEGQQEKTFHYLIGILIVNGNTMNKYSFWADTPEKEQEIFHEFLEIMKDQTDFTVYHYGKYEMNFLKRMKKSIDNESDLIDQIQSHSCNLLSVFFTNIYLPTYTNGLKDVGKYIGFQWSDEKASGLQSLVWRKRWDITGDKTFKEKLIQYNQDDCHALYRVKKLIEGIITKESEENDNVVHFKNFRKNSNLKFIIGEFAMPEFEQINKCAYFDYQRERVHVRTNPYLKKYYAKKPKRTKTKYRLKCKPNEIINPVTNAACPLCDKKNRKRFNPLSKKAIDLKFTRSGVRRHVIEYQSNLYYCRKCKKSFIPAEYKNIRHKYGHNLMCWTIYEHIVNKQSFRQIEATLFELFGLKINKSNVHTFKSYINEYYKDTFNFLSEKILRSRIIYVDETPINMRFETGYAWIFSNMEEVVTFYKPTREGEFLKEYLADYKGILVSDFYAAYDSLDCLQQKCLIHLIRDFNDDLLKNPFDEEFKDIARRFTLLMQSIVETIDQYGLKKRHLNKHNKSVDKFFKVVLSGEYKSEVATQYQKRFARNREKLFLFLNHDGVSWNNSIAEHAIKLLATHKNKNLNFFRESRMEEYLQLMSIYQTCHYKGISFLKFLLSKEKDMDSYCQRMMRKNRIDE